MWARALAGPVAKGGTQTDRLWVTARVLLARDSLVTAATRGDNLIGGAEDLTHLGYMPTRPMPSATSTEEALSLLGGAATRLAVVAHRLEEPDGRRRARGLIGERRLSFDDVVNIGIHRAHRQFFELTRRLAAARLRLIDPGRPLPVAALHPDRGTS